MPLETVFSHRPRRWLAVAAAAVLAVTTAGALVLRPWDDDSRRNYLDATGWPAHGQAAYVLSGRLHASSGERPVPIASLAKVMTALVVLRHHPLAASEQGFTLHVDHADVADTEARQARDESLVPVSAGEQLTERQALVALLLPSANNVAAILARSIAGDGERFVAMMNAEAARLGMTHTHYTDPSGFLSTTVSTARDQVLLARAAGRLPALTSVTALRSAVLPDVGTVHNTDLLIGTDGFVGTKTGSDDEAGGCFMFTTWRVVARRPQPLIGVVLGQQGRHPLTAGLYAAREWADHLAPELPG